MNRVIKAVGPMALGLVLGFSSLVGAVSAPLTMDLSTAKSTVEFLAIGRPSMLKIAGKLEANEKDPGLSGNLKIEKGRVSGVAEVTLDKLKTGIKLRDRHMRETYLKTAEHPKAKLVFDTLEWPESVQSAEGKATAVPFKGTLEVHGVSSPVEGSVDIVRGASDVKMDFSFRTTIKAHEMEIPSFMGVTVADDVKVSVSVQGPLVGAGVAKEKVSSLGQGVPK